MVDFARICLAGDRIRTVKTEGLGDQTVQLIHALFVAIKEGKVGCLCPGGPFGSSETELVADRAPTLKVDQEILNP